MTGPDGKLSAVEVHVFPESARGTVEGHRPMDILPGATMTNATVAELTKDANERTLVLRYKDGEQTIRVPNGVPVVSQKPGDRSLLVAGAKVTVIEQMRDGQAGRDANPGRQQGLHAADLSQRGFEAAR